MHRRAFVTATSLTLGAVALGSGLPLGLAQSPPETTALPPLVRTGLLLLLSDIDVAKDRVTFVWADVVRITGTIHTGGHPLHIVARRIEFVANARIDSQGHPASPTYPPGNRAGVGPSAGDNGRDGDNGGSGNHAGDVLLLADSIAGEIDITANGGQGGNAQSGGEGAKGNAGQPQQVACRDGPPGGTGGRGGIAGAPGNGGNGGTVKIYAQAREDERPEINVAAGDPGKPALHGPAGDGGPGGRGGPERFEKDFEGSRRID